MNRCQFCASGSDSQLVLQELDLLLDEVKTNESSRPQEQEQEHEGAQGAQMMKRVVSMLVKEISQLVLKPGDRNSSTNPPVADLEDDRRLDGEMVDIYLIISNPRCRGGIQIVSALSVIRNNLDTVVQLLEDEIIL